MSILEHILAFVYSIAHLIGNAFLNIFGTIFPNVNVPAHFADTVGYLTIITAILILFQFARKIAIAIVIIAWGFIVIRLMLIIFGLY